MLNSFASAPHWLREISGLASKMAGRACLGACLSDYARSQATHRQAATESFEIGSTGCPDDLWCAIPVYNHGATVKDVALRAGAICPRVVVVDDGSTDSDVAGLFSGTGVTVLKHEHNRGKGEALRTAAAFIHGQGGRWVVTLDADGQHDPSEIPLFAAHAGSEDLIVLGVRPFDDPNVPRRSRIGRWLSNLCAGIETGQRVLDSQSGYRLYPVKLLHDTQINSKNYAYETEILAYGAWMGCRIVNIAVSVYYPPREERVTHFDFVADNLRIGILHLRLMVKSLFLKWSS